MSANTLNRKWGAVTLPLDATGETDLASLDPARDILLGLFTAALNDELAARWADAAVSTPLAGTDPVVGVFPSLPDLDTMRQVKQGFPLLAVARSNDAQQEDEVTLWQFRITSKWSVNYVLGPLELGNELKLSDVLVEAGRILASVIRAGGHKAYRATVSSGQSFPSQVFQPGAGNCNFSTIRIASFMQGPAAFSQGGPKYHALTMVLETTELDSDVSTAPDLTGKTVSLGLSGDGGALPGLVQGITPGDFSNDFGRDFRLLAT